MALQSFTIMAGPSKFDLMLALFDLTANKPHKVSFTLHETTYTDVRVNSVSQEDGSGESWNIAGYISRAGDTLERFSAYYRTDLRTGRFKLLAS